MMTCLQQASTGTHRLSRPTSHCCGLVGLPQHCRIRRHTLETNDSKGKSKDEFTHAHKKGRHHTMIYTLHDKGSKCFIAASLGSPTPMQQELNLIKCNASKTGAMLTRVQNGLHCMRRNSPPAICQTNNCKATELRAFTALPSHREFAIENLSSWLVLCEQRNNVTNHI